MNHHSQDGVVELLNMSGKGLNAADYLSILKHEGLALQPDAVMIGFYINDIEADPSNRPDHSFLPPFLHTMLSRGSYLYWYSYSMFDAWKNQERYLEYFLSYTSADSYDWERFAIIWKEILEICRENGLSAWVVILPQLHMLNDRHPFIPVYDRVAELSRKNGARVIDLFPAVRGREARYLWIGRTDSHPNEAAHRIFADHIYEIMVQVRPADGRIGPK